jgi:hypothetical protein
MYINYYAYCSHLYTPAFRQKTILEKELNTVFVPQIFNYTDVNIISHVISTFLYCLPLIFVLSVQTNPLSLPN